MIWLYFYQFWVNFNHFQSYFEALKGDKVASARIHGRKNLYDLIMLLSILSQFHPFLVKSLNAQWWQSGISWNSWQEMAMSQEQQKDVIFAI